MMNNVRSEINKGRYSNEKAKNECISLIMKMLNTKDKDEYVKCLAVFNTKGLNPANIVDHLEVTGDNDFQDSVGKNQDYNYFNKNWVSIKNKWAGHLTKKTRSFRLSYNAESRKCSLCTQVWNDKNNGSYNCL